MALPLVLHWPKRTSASMPATACTIEGLELASDGEEDDRRCPCTLSQCGGVRSSPGSWCCTSTGTRQTM
jgi:hypothetical protein